MPYTKTTWVNGVAPALSAANLNNLETQYDQSVADMALREMGPVLFSGRYHNPLLLETAAGGLALVADNIYATAFWTPCSYLFDRIWTWLTVAAAGGKKMRMGIYEEGGSGYPGDLVVDGGEQAADVANANEAVIAETLPGGFYWLAIISDGAPTVAAGQPLLSVIGNISESPLITPPGGGWTQAQAYGALPDPFPAAGTVFIGHVLRLRRA